MLSILENMNIIIEYLLYKQENYYIECLKYYDFTVKILFMKVYFDKTIVEKIERIPFLNPILWNREQWDSDNTWFYSNDQILERTSKWGELLSYSNIESCDYIVFPINLIIG